MSILLTLCVLAAAGWLALSVISRDPTDDPGDSVAAYSRAMSALDPTGGTHRRTRRAPRSRPRSARARHGRPVAHRSAAAPRRRAVRR